jgi:hypothetical protein
MPKPKDIQGQKFGRLTVVALNRPASFRILPNGKRGTLSNTWDCVCECGNTRKNIPRYQLQHGSVKSCGCLKVEAIRKSQIHQIKGTEDTPSYVFTRGRGNFYITWRALKERCYFKKHKSFHNYGGRGIKIHSAWKSSYRAFALDVGPRPSPKHSIDRIDTNKDYAPGNVRWATAKEQANNTRKNVWLQWKGESITLTQLAELEQVSYNILHRRIRKYQMNPEEAVASAKKTGKPFVRDKRHLAGPQYDFC